MSNDHGGEDACNMYMYIKWYTYIYIYKVSISWTKHVQHRQGLCTYHSLYSMRFTKCFGIVVTCYNGVGFVMNFPEMIVFDNWSKKLG